MSTLLPTLLVCLVSLLSLHSEKTARGDPAQPPPSPHTVQGCDFHLLISTVPACASCRAPSATGPGGERQPHPARGWTAHTWGKHSPAGV